MKFNINCLQCGTECITDRKNGKFCSFECNKKWQNNKYATIRRNKNNSKYENVPACLLCGLQSTMLLSHINRIHNLSADEYKTQFNVDDSALYHESYIQQLSDNIKGNKNPAYDHGGKFSPFSEKFIKYEDMINIEKERVISDLYVQVSETRTGNNNDSTKIEYYIKRGASYDESIKLLAERQSTFTLEKCIEKHGTEEGTKIYNDRQERWLASFYNKSEEEIKDINRRKIDNIATSGPAVELFKALQLKFLNKIYKYSDRDTGNREHILYNENTKKHYKIDFMNDEDKKIIEFNGNYFHGNPSMYNETDVLHTTGETYKLVWERDRLRIEELESMGYRVLVIWEYDFKYNRNKIIEECINFLN